MNSSLVIILPKQLPILTEDRKKGPQMITVPKWFQKFQSVNENPRDKGDRGQPCSLDNKHLEAIIEQNSRENVREMYEALRVSSSTLSDHVKRICKTKRLDKWVPQ